MGNTLTKRMERRLGLCHYRHRGKEYKESGYKLEDYYSYASP